MIAIIGLCSGGNEDIQDIIQGNRKLFDGIDLIISATGSIRANLCINQFAWKAKIPAIYGGVWERGFGREVLRIIPGETPCYDCVLGQTKLPEWSLGGY